MNANPKATINFNTDEEKKIEKRKPSLVLLKIENTLKM